MIKITNLTNATREQLLQYIDKNQDAYEIRKITINTLISKVAALSYFIGRYGNHDWDCKKSPCSCGYQQALSKVDLK